MYTHGSKQGFAAFRQVVLALHEHKADQIVWMKLSEIARYWTAKDLTRMTSSDGQHLLRAPFACPQFTVRVPRTGDQPPAVLAAGERIELRPVSAPDKLQGGTWLGEPRSCVLCFDLPRGETEMVA